MATISLCMIVKNEEPVLERILKPMRTVVDEIIIADTGSTDSTKEIACRYGDQVFDYAWKQDFAAARNAACERASMDYWMWLDADDVIRPDQLEGLRQLKETLDPKIDVVMMRYVAAFDAAGRPSFTYYRERLLRNDKTFLWQGRVHEAVTPKGCILYSPITIEHRKEKAGDSRRNLEIYRQMIRDGEALEPRHQFYYGRELFDHGEYEMAAKALEQFLKEPGGWKENRIDACLLLSRCKSREGDSEGAASSTISPEGRSAARSESLKWRLESIPRRPGGISRPFFPFPMSPPAPSSSLIFTALSLPSSYASAMTAWAKGSRPFTTTRWLRG